MLLSAVDSSMGTKNPVDTRWHAQVYLNIGNKITPKHMQGQVHYLVFHSVENMFWLFYICLYIRFL